jgi:L-fucose mutarotase
MLRGIDPLLVPDLLHALASMGHGDRIAIVDCNFPGASNARTLIRLPGLSAMPVLNAIMSVFPLDTFVPDPAVVMAVVGEPDTETEPEREFTSVLRAHGAGPPSRIDRHAFYREASAAFAIVQTGERRFYGNIILTKGVIAPP